MLFAATTRIDRPPAEVWRFVIDVSHDRLWRTGVVESGLRTGPLLEVGSVGYTRVVSRGRRQEGEWRIVELRAPYLARWSFLSGPFVGGGAYRLDPAGRGTRFTLLADVRMKGLGRLLGPLVWIVGRRQNQADVERLRSILEGA